MNEQLLPGHELEVKLLYTILALLVFWVIRQAIRYLCAPRRRRGTEQEIWESILEAFARHDDIDFAYSTHRYYDNRHEGKPGARAADDGASG